LVRDQGSEVQILSPRFLFSNANVLGSSGTGTAIILRTIQAWGPDMRYPVRA
jgi:hypothetical protein